MELPIVVLDAKAPDFTFTAPTKLKLGQGGTGSFSVEFTSAQGFDAPVEVTFAGLPLGVTAEPTTGRVGSPARVTITASAASTLGTTAADIICTSGTLVHLSKLNLEIVDRGTVDSSFGLDGSAMLGLSGSPSQLIRMAIDPQDRIVAVGTDSSELTVARLSSGGALDASFGSAGVARVSLPGGSGFAVCLASAPDEKWWVGGYAYSTASGEFTAHLMRLGSDGALDATFRQGGVASMPWGNYSAVVGVTPQGDSVLVTGLSYDPSTFEPGAVVTRLTASGVIDTTFGTAGMVTLPGALGVASRPLPDGTLMVLAYEETAWVLFKLSADGVLESSFGTGGRQTLALGSSTANTGTTALDLAIGPDGKILVLGYMIDSSNTVQTVIFRVHPDGQADTPFGTAGVVRLNGLHIRQLLLNDDGTLYLPGCSLQPGMSAGRLLKLSSTGAVDPSFGDPSTGGVPLLGGRPACAATVAQQSNGRLLVGGGLGNDSADQGWFMTALKP